MTEKTPSVDDIMRYVMESLASTPSGHQLDFDSMEIAVELAFVFNERRVSLWSKNGKVFDVRMYPRLEGDVESTVFSVGYDSDRDRPTANWYEGLPSDIDLRAAVYTFVGTAFKTMRKMNPDFFK